MGMPRNYLKARKALEETIPTRPPVAITNEDGGLRVNVYGEIGPWGINATDFVQAFTALDPGKNAIHVHVNSPGGDVYDGLAIYQTLKASPAKVVVHIDGLAASAASFIAMAGDEIEMGRNARMMIHDASTMDYGNAQDKRETADWLDEESDNIADIYAQRAGGNASGWRATMKDEKWYSAEQALKAGLVTSIQGEVEDAVSVATSLFRNSPGGPAQPETEDSDNVDFVQVANALRGAF